MGFLVWPGRPLWIFITNIRALNHCIFLDLSIGLGWRGEGRKEGFFVYRQAGRILAGRKAGFLYVDN